MEEHADEIEFVVESAKKAAAHVGARIYIACALLDALHAAYYESKNEK